MRIFSFIHPFSLVALLVAVCAAPVSATQIKVRVPTGAGSGSAAAAAGASHVSPTLAPPSLVPTLSAPLNAPTLSPSHLAVPVGADQALPQAAAVAAEPAAVPGMAQAVVTPASPQTFVFEFDVNEEEGPAASFKDKVTAKTQQLGRGLMDALDTLRDFDFSHSEPDAAERQGWELFDGGGVRDALAPTVGTQQVLQGRLLGRRSPSGLMPIRGPADARFLVPPAKVGYGYSKEDPKFVGPMAEAIRDGVRVLAQVSEGRDITTNELRTIMDNIAWVRQDIAYDKGDSDWYNFGARIPEHPSEFKSFNGNRPFKQRMAGPDALRNGTTIDAIPSDEREPGNRHAKLYPRAHEIVTQEGSGSRGPKEKVFIDFEMHNLSQLRSRGEGLYYLFHPTFEEMVPMRAEAFRLLGEAFNNPTISEKAFVNVMAEAYQLLVHATPYIRGSPAIMESFYDVLLRVKFGKTMPQKTGEPFWDAVFWSPQDGPYTGERFLRNFGGT
jgi:hypothetical protein